jgi:hypothetical protein
MTWRPMASHRPRKAPNFDRHLLRREVVVVVREPDADRVRADVLDALELGLHLGPGGPRRIEADPHRRRRRDVDQGMVGAAERRVDVAVGRDVVETAQVSVRRIDGLELGERRRAQRDCGEEDGDLHGAPGHGATLPSDGQQRGSCRRVLRHHAPVGRQAPLARLGLASPQLHPGRGIDRRRRPPGPARPTPERQRPG